MGSVAGVRARARRMFVRAVGAVMVATGLVAVVPGPASAAEWWESSQTATWYDGQPTYSSVMNCFSVIQGSPYYEYGVGAYIGYLADPDNLRPSTGDKTWIRYRVYGMGNPCPGGSYFRPKFYLPQGWSWDTTRQIACGYDGSGGSAPQANCPGWSNMDASNAYWNNGSGQGGNMWGVAQGHYWEFQFPVTVSSSAQSGVILDAHLDVADGNFNPQLLMRTSNVYVFNGANPAANSAAVMYDQPSSWNAAQTTWQPVTATKYGMLSAFKAFVGNKAGTARLEISTDPNMSSILGTDQLSWNANQFGSAIQVTTDWGAPIPQLQTGATYYWRGVITRSGEAPVAGSVQSFKLLPGGGVEASAIGGSMSGGGVGTGAGGVPGGAITPIPVPQPPAPNPPAAATATSSVAKTVKAKKGVKVTISCTGACTAQAAATVSKKVARKLGLKKGSLGTGKASLTAAGSKVVTIKLSKAVQKRLKRLKKVSATVKVTTTVAGTTSSKTWKVTITG